LDLVMGRSWVGVRPLDLILSRIKFMSLWSQSYCQLDGIEGYHLHKDELCCGGEGEFMDGVYEYGE